MDLTDSHVEYHRERIDRLTIGYWITAAVVALVVSIVLFFTPLRWIGLPLGVLIALGLALLMWRRSEGWLIASCGGRQVSETDEPRLHNLVDGLCVTSGVIKPELRVVESPSSNLVAVGRRPDRVVLVVTSGALTTLGRIELEALLATEISQIRSLDTAHVTTAATTLGLPSLLAEVGGRWRSGKAITEGTAGFAGRLGGLAALAAIPFAGISRTRLRHELEPHRDFRTDASALDLTRYPPGMIAALESLSSAGTTLDATAASGPLWVVDPAGISDLRPALGARVEALREL